MRKTEDGRHRQNTRRENRMRAEDAIDLCKMGDGRYRWEIGDGNNYITKKELEDSKWKIDYDGRCNTEGRRHKTAQTD